MNKEIKEKIIEIILETSAFNRNSTKLLNTTDQLLELFEEEKQKWLEENMPKEDDFDNELEKGRAYSPGELGTFIARAGVKLGFNICLKEIKDKLLPPI